MLSRLSIQSKLNRLRMLAKMNATSLRSFSTSDKDQKILYKYHTENSFEFILNNPKVLNSLDMDMIDLIWNQLRIWKNTKKSPRVVFMKGTGEKAFCAGGDIKSIYNDGAKGLNPSTPKTFFAKEYIVDYALTQMEPIQISVWNGIVMGGGVGISVHAPIRIATEKTVFAMPETGIGFFTDVGGGYFLSRVNNNISDGLYLGLTGHRLKGKDLLYWGVATHYIETSKLNELYDDINKNATKDSTFEDIKKIVDKHSDHLTDGHEHSEHSIHLHREGHCLLHNKKCTVWKSDENTKEIDEDTVIRRGCRTFNYWFQPDSIHKIKERLETVANGHKTDLDASVAQKALAQISKYSPISCAVVTEQIKRGKTMTLKDVFVMEYKLP